ncbi:hypothetical protein B0T25DRAFT_548269 [Lasiosphaeria hispida]|uniref:Uncharacterized protein n=1 Tax=Lasiosphaeria hispida TaxID=260671 RepID=A0AAJ0MCR6_9PEZI|nr:hypothetical protein B0T25DRAFT_548269 [Lasiosphaeria hispida]
MPTLVESTQDNDPPTVRFTNVQDLFDVINCTTGDFLTVTTSLLVISPKSSVSERSNAASSVFAATKAIPGS